jgi:predicted pyridoxine 5'-phosphate oxidase superfamily flavin-nucleotide-binding protein
MKRVVTEIQLCYAATVAPDGKPNLSPKGSITVLSDDELGFADLASPGTIENLRHNPAIELNVVDPFTRRGFRFKGAAQMVKDPKRTFSASTSEGPLRVTNGPSTRALGWTEIEPKADIGSADE